MIRERPKTEFVYLSGNLAAKVGGGGSWVLLSPLRKYKNSNFKYIKSNSLIVKQNLKSHVQFCKILEKPFHSA